MSSIFGLITLWNLTQWRRHLHHSALLFDDGEKQRDSSHSILLDLLLIYVKLQIRHTEHLLHQCGNICERFLNARKVITLNVEQSNLSKLMHEKNQLTMKIFSLPVCRLRFSHSKTCYLQKCLTELLLFQHDDDTYLTRIYDSSLLTYCGDGYHAWPWLHLLIVHCSLLPPPCGSLAVESS